MILSHKGCRQFTPYSEKISPSLDAAQSASRSEAISLSSVLESGSTSYSLVSLVDPSGLDGKRVG